MNPHEAGRLMDRLIAEGFDLTTHTNRSVSPRCSQCDAKVIQGIACHEYGCPNQVKEEEDDT